MIKNSVTIMDINKDWFPSKYQGNTKIHLFRPDLATENNISININYVHEWQPDFSKTPNKKIIDFVEKNKSTDTKLIFEMPRVSVYISEVLHKIYSFIDESSFDYKNVYLLTACINIKQIYENWLEQNSKKYKINIIAVSNWEKELKLISNQNLNKFVTFSSGPKPKKFLCFNRRDCWHRFACVMMLQHLDLIKHGYISFFPSGFFPGEPDIEIKDEKYFELLKQEFRNEHLIDTIKNSYEKIKSDLPYKLNSPIVQRSTEYAVDKIKNFLAFDDLPYFKNSCFSLVTETLFFEDISLESHRQNYLSEKTFKPIFMKHPFILMAWPGSLEFLRTLGYKTFEGLIDESYDLINNPSDRFLAIIKEVERLCKLSDSDLLEWQNHIKPIVEHNFQHFFSKNNPQDYILEQITAELL